MSLFTHILTKLLSPLSNCDEGVTDNDGLNITTREVLDVIGEAELKDAPESVYDCLSFLTGSITSTLSSLLSLSPTMVLLPIELNSIQILSLPLERAFTFIFKYSHVWLLVISLITCSIAIISLSSLFSSSSSSLTPFTSCSLDWVSLSTVSTELNFCYNDNQKVMVIIITL